MFHIIRRTKIFKDGELISDIKVQVYSSESLPRIEWIAANHTDVLRPKDEWTCGKANCCGTSVGYFIHDNSNRPATGTVILRPRQKLATEILKIFS